MLGTTKASFSNTGRVLIVRSKSRSIALLVLAVGFALAAFIAMLVALVKHHEAGALIAGPLGTAGLFYAGWVVARRTTIQLTARGIVIENVFTRREIPWGHGRQFYIANGIRLRLLDGTSYGTWAFQGSVAGAATNYASLVPIVEKLTRASDKIVQSVHPAYPPPDSTLRFQIPDWWIPLSILVGVEAVLLPIWLATRH
jgi:hypothetical protein